MAQTFKHFYMTFKLISLQILNIDLGQKDSINLY